MRILTVIFISILFLSGCKKEEINHSNDPKIQEYRSIWEDLFKSRNNISDAYFKQHVRVSQASLYTPVGGETFTINYQLKISWAAIEIRDQFIIKIDPTNETYPYLEVSRTDYLTKDEINTILFKGAFHSKIATVEANTGLKYSSKNQAMMALQQHTKVDQLKIERMYYKEQKAAHNANGHPYLAVSGVIAGSENTCVYAEIDLVTGEGESRKDACVVN